MAAKSKEPPLTKADIVIGGNYRAKRPTRMGSLFGPEKFNDRHVLWIDDLGFSVQYDGPAVRRGAKYPSVRMDAFLKWAGKRLPDDMEIDP